VNREGIRAVFGAVDGPPVVRNGDDRTVADVEPMLRETGRTAVHGRANAGTCSNGMKIP
jgi:hypothetical protein